MKRFGLARGLGEHALVGGFVLRQQGERGLRRAGLALLEQHAHAAPDVGDREAAAQPEERAQALAALGQLGGSSHIAVASSSAESSPCSRREIQR